MISFDSFKLIGAGVAILLVIAAIWAWREEIKSGVYNEVYRDQVEQALRQKDAEIARLNRLNATSTEALARASQTEAQLRQTNDSLVQTLNSLNLSGQVSDDLGRALDEIQQMDRR